MRSLASGVPSRFGDPIWSRAARNRDFVAHHDDRVDADALWVTVDRSSPELRAVLDRVRG